MKKTISNILMFSLLLMGLVSCEKESMKTVFGEGEQDCIVFALKSRADAQNNEDQIASVVKLNEDLINTVDLFFFEDINGEYKYHYSYTGISSQTTHSVSVPTENLDMTGQTSYYIYAIVNRSVGENEATDKKLASLKALAANRPITVNDITTDEDESIQECFVMDGFLQSTLDIDSEETKYVIPLERAASKISLEITVDNEVVVGEGDDQVTYTPVGTMKVEMVKGVKNGIVNGKATNPTDFITDTGRSIATNESGNDHVPFYSYPTDWNKNEENECYLNLTMDWKNGKTGNQKPYYYIVPIGDPEKGYITELVRNTHYKIDLNVAILGGTTPEKSVVLTPNYIIEKWSEERIDTELKNYKYLWVETNEVTVYNENTVSIAYAAMEEATVSITSIVKPDYSKDEAKLDNEIFTGSDDEVTTSECSDLLKNCKVSLEDGHIVLEHELVNNRSSANYDFVPYTITIEVKNSVKTETITVIQYPACYIYSYVDDKTPGNSTLSDGGTVWVNGVQQGSTYPDIGQVPNNYPGNENNPNMYVFTVTAFDKSFGSDYVIADPREDEVNLLGWTKGASWKAAGHVNGNTNWGLTYYYPTRTDNPNLIAPRFMVTSAYSYPQGREYSKDQVVKRCASLQEFGFPAGRWRVPTNAEIEFIAQMCVEGKIPQIFTEDVNYHSATNVYAFNPQDNSVGISNFTTGSVRCVYDLWYWGEQDKLTGNNLNVFTWGDKVK